MKRSIVLFIFTLLALSVSAQKYMTKTGFIGFYSHTPTEDIKADNNQVEGFVDISTGELVFQVLIKSFHFERALIKENFNGSYLESEKFPKSGFKGKITNIASLDLKKTGKYDVVAEGQLTIRDVTKPVKVKGTLEVTATGLNASTKFKIVPEDFNIAIPDLVREKIAKDIEITVIMKYSPM